jgi:basic membrane protein A
MKKLTLVLSVVIAATMLLTACAPAAGAGKKVCMVTDSAGIGDKSFNDIVWAGLQQGAKDFGVTANYIESKSADDYAPNLAACVDEKADLIVCTGFMMADACKAAVTANPKIMFGGIDISGFNLPNFRGAQARMDQNSFQAGYLAAGMTQKGKVATFTGFFGPVVQIFMDGFYMGVQDYNKVHGTSVAVLGYDPKDTTKAAATGSWIDVDKGRQMGETFMDQGADIILPVAGNVGTGTAAVMQERKYGYIFGVDQDWLITNPTYSAQILGSVLKRLNVPSYDFVKQLVNGTWQGGDFTGNFTNGGVEFAYNPAITIPAALKAEADALVAKIKSGEILTLSPEFLAANPTYK